MKLINSFYTCMFRAYLCHIHLYIYDSMHYIFIVLNTKQRKIYALIMCTVDI